MGNSGATIMTTKSIAEQDLLHLEKHMGKEKFARYRARLTKRTAGPYDMRYCEPILPKAPIPEGRYLVHNHVKPQRPLGRTDFRAWTQNSDENLVQCDCDFGGCKNAGLHQHYRVATHA